MPCAKFKAGGLFGDAVRPSRKLVVLPIEKHVEVDSCNYAEIES